jgi:7-cyano-7-deazaguanine synthase
MKAVLTFSGGLDSTVLLHHLKAEGHELYALSVDYGQRHAKELEAAANLAGALEVPHRIADLKSIRPLLAGGSLTSSEIDVPEGHYAEESMKATVVPNRNMILLSLATAWAVSLKADCVAYAAHGGDHAIYPDCRPEFADAMGVAIERADWHSVQLLRPFMKMTKGDIVRRGHELGVPFADTWSCYKGGAVHCGRCGTCIERREAFHLAGIEDPTHYDSEAPSVDELARNDWKLVA